MIIGFSGKKQSGKTTSANVLLGLKMLQIKLTNEFSFNDKGQLYIHDLAGDEEMCGVWDISRREPYFLNFCEENLFPYVKFYSFADSLKESIVSIFQINPECVYETDKKKNTPTHVKWESFIESEKKGPMSGRDLMQFVGTDVWRRNYPDIWADSLVYRIKKENPGLALVPDVRFPNEVRALQSTNGKVIRLLREPFPDDKHESETALDDFDGFDAIIDNRDLTIEQTNNKVIEIAKTWDAFPEEQFYE